MRKFDTKVQYLRYKVLREVARLSFDDALLAHYNDIPKMIVPGPEPSMRCCIYKERAIVLERIRMATGGDRSNGNVIEVLDIACDECPVSGYSVTHDLCRGCIAHRCEDVCKRNALTFDEHQKAHIDKSKCVECGMCAKVCPYSAIINRKRPCENACKIKAISMADTKEAKIDNEKCIACGACVYQCPFGAIADKSYIIDAIDMLKKSDDNRAYKVYAVVAPSISSQFSYASLGQVISAIKALGFYHVVEAALGADMVAFEEAKELREKGFLTSSCCPAFVQYVKTQFPTMIEHISHNASPMTTIAKYIKQLDPTGKVVFIGPCTAKKQEALEENVRQFVDCVLTFEELQALIDGKGIELDKLKADVLDNASFFGRIFARSGGLSEAVAEALQEQDCTDFQVESIACDGIEACKVALLKASKGVLPQNFIEGMACTGGCIGGAGCLTHGEKDRSQVDKYGREALEKSISDAIRFSQQV